MSSIFLPSRGQVAPARPGRLSFTFTYYIPVLTFFQDICGLCEHGIHAHTDYVSTVVNHYPANRCVAYAQKYCTCEAQFCEHIATYNPYRLPEPWTVLDYFNPDSNCPSPSATMSSHFNDANSPFSPGPGTTSSNYDTTILSGDARNVSLTPAPIYSPSASSSTSPTIQPDTTQTLGYSSGGYFAQYSNHFVNSPYAGPESGATNESFEYQDYGNAMYAEPPEDWSGSYGA
ncbi:hypothetical protein EV421DRAFT_2022792 [Armillaria borealis]|uniref:Uncharacterized protein n=1 Tax=Armillaria borealis TaxID=47425 RepID=A0AA39J449_9AGAR|nr:hypothetical protein EV421DRAFT_2022792 [Armillaria borealis]